MDADRFDAIARTSISATNRRYTLGALLGGALAVLGVAPPDTSAAKSGKCKPKCGECEKCKKGDCDKKNGKKVCKKGKCKPKADGTPCTAFAGGVCRTGACVNLQTDEANCGSVSTVCGPSQVCQAGSCFPSGTCPASTTQMCPGGGPTPRCGSNPDAPGIDCQCSRSAEGNVVCIWNDDTPCGSLTPCTSSASCGAGSACVALGPACCPEGPAHACLARCPDPTA